MIRELYLKILYSYVIVRFIEYLHIHCIVKMYFCLLFILKMPLDILRNELSNSILSLQPEPEIPPELPPPRPHVRCCWFATLETKWNGSRKGKMLYSALQSFWKFPFALCNPSQSYTLTCKYANMQFLVSFGYKLHISLQITIFHSLSQCRMYILGNVVLRIWSGRNERYNVFWNK